MLDLADLQRQAGHEVEFFGMTHPENLTLPHADRFPSEVQLDPLPDRWQDKVRSAGRMLWSSSARSGIDGVLERFEPDVVHLHNIYHQLSPSILGPMQQRGITTVLTAHDYKLVCPSYLMLDKGSICDACVGSHFGHAIKRRCKGGSLVGSTLLAVESTVHHRMGVWDSLDAVICPSEFMVARMREAGCLTDKLHHIPHFAGLDDTGSGAVGSVPASERSGVIFAGRLDPIKGVDTLIRAVPDLPAGTLVTICGDGPIRAELEALAEELAPGQVEFTGRLDRAELTKRVARAVCVALPSRVHENQPMAILEGFSVGTPAVASSLGGIPELVTPGETGWLVEMDDHTALAGRISVLLADPVQAAKMGERGREWAAENFSVELHLEAVESIYSSRGSGKAKAELG